MWGAYVCTRGKKSPGDHRRQQSLQALWCCWWNAGQPTSLERTFKTAVTTQGKEKLSGNKYPPTEYPSPPSCEMSNWLYSKNSWWGFPGGSSKESICQFSRCQRRRFDPWARKILWGREWQPTPDAGSIPGSGRSSGEGNDNPLQNSRLGNHTDRGAWWATVHGVTKSWTGLSMHTHGT